MKETLEVMKAENTYYDEAGLPDWKKGIPITLRCHYESKCVLILYLSNHVSNTKIFYEKNIVICHVYDT